jgi:hypothetical protein
MQEEMLLLNWPGSAAAVLTTETSSHQYDKRKITNVVSQFGGVCMLVGGTAGARKYLMETRFQWKHGN